MSRMSGSSAAETVSVETLAQPALVTFEEFFLDEHPRLFRALWLLTRDRHEAEELEQDAFVRVLERWDRVSSLTDPVGYLYRTAMNLFRSRLRRAAAGVGRALDPPREPSVEAVEERDAVTRALGSLTPRERAAVVLMHALGFSSEEAGRALRIRPSTARVLAARGRARLRMELDTHE